MTGLCADRVVLITGAGSGLGRAYALAFARAGAQVVVNDVSREDALGVVEEIRDAGGQAMADHGDVADMKAAEHMVRQAVEAFDALHVVVNNAGIVRDRMFVNCSEEEWDAVIRVHLRGHFCIGRQAAGYWRDCAKQGQSLEARIINTSSGAGLQGSIGQSGYSAAKGGIAALTLVQAAELGRYGITANALAPSARTRMTETAFAERMKKPEDGSFDHYDPANVAPLVVWLGSTQSAQVSGRVFEVEGGRISLADGWRTGDVVDAGRRWEPEEIGPAVEQLLARSVAAQPVYGT